MPISPNTRFSQLQDSSASHQEIASEVAGNINTTIGSITGDVKTKLSALFSGGLRESGAAAVTSLKDFETKLTTDDVLKNALTTNELRKSYRDDFVNILDMRAGPSTTEPTITYNFLGTKNEMRNKINALISQDERTTAQSTTQEQARQREQETQTQRDQYDAEHKGEDQPPSGGVFKKFVARPLGVAGLSTLAGAGILKATEGLALSNVPILGPLMNVPALQSATAAINTTATTVAATEWFSWSALLLKFAGTWLTPGLAAGAATVGGLWALGKIREGAERREYYKHNPTGRFKKKAFLQNVAGGAGLLLSPLKLIPGIPRAIGSVAGWGIDKIKGGAQWVGNNAGTIVKGAGVGTLVGGGLLIAGALASPAAAILVGAGTTGLYTLLNHKGSSGSAAQSAAGTQP